MGHTALPLSLCSLQHSQDGTSLSLRQMSPIAFPPPSSFSLPPSLDLSSLGAIFYPLLFSMLRRLSVSIGPSEESAEGG